ncbi:MAG: response regulator [Sphaerochaetaceae bacterium]|nr:helix-turn-helix domain-containing protein [uncultured Sphaerochaeta sp.]MDC7229635.1 response regulator [Sphaerochaetaceae bacterium]
MRILIADDEKPVCTVLLHHLSLYGSPYLETKTVHDGNALRESRDTWSPHVIFTDICMPGLSGLEAINEIRQHQCSESTSIYIMSGYSDFDYARQALKLGVKDYLLKPVRYSQVEDIIKSEESKIYRGLSLKDAYSLKSEERALEISLSIQQLVSAFESKDIVQMIEALDAWRECNNTRSFRIDPDFFSNTFKERIETVDEQRTFIEQAIRDPQFQVVKDKSIDSIVTYITTHFTNPSFCMDMVADYFGYSTQYLSTLFKKELSENFSHYLTRLRIERAKELLTIPTMKVKDVGTSCGYPYPSYFIKVFRCETGLTPSEWKRENRA